MIFELTRFGKSGCSDLLCIGQKDFTCLVRMAPPQKIIKAIPTASNIFYRTQVQSLFTFASNSLTDWLTDCCLVDLIDVTLACEDAYSKLVEVVTVADVSDKDHRVGICLLKIWKLRFGQKAKLLFRLWAQGLVKILKLKFRQDLKLDFGQYFAADVLYTYEVESWSRFWN